MNRMLIASPAVSPLASLLPPDDLQGTAAPSPRLGWSARAVGYILALPRLAVSGRRETGHGSSLVVWKRVIGRAFGGQLAALGVTE